MTVTIDQDLKEILALIERKLDNLQKDVTDIKISVARLDERTENIDKRLDKVETSQKNQIWALIGILGTGVIAAVIRFVLSELPQ